MGCRAFRQRLSSLLNRLARGRHFNKGIAVFAALILPYGSAVVAQGRFTITFDGPPQFPPGTGRLVQYYTETGMVFTAIMDGASFGRQYYTGDGSLAPTNGGTYLQAGFGSTLSFAYYDGPSFGLASVELAGYSYLASNFAVNFVGYKSDGSTLTTTFSGAGLTFRPFAFGSEWASGLTRVEIPNEPWSLDNLTVNVPEPPQSILAILAMTLLGAGWKRIGKLRTDNILGAALLCVCCLGASAGAQTTDPNEYVVEPTRDRASFNFSIDNPLAVVPSGTNYMRIIAGDIPESHTKERGALGTAVDF